jgi:hypothetical protein
MGNKEKPVENALCPFSYGRMSRISGVGWWKIKWERYNVSHLCFP